MDGELHVGLVDDQHRAGGAHVGVQRGDELRCRQHQAAVGERRLDKDRGDVTAGQPGAQRVGVVVGQDVGGLRGGGVEPGEVAVHAAVVAA